MFRAIRGTRDLLPPQTATWNRIEDVARRVFHAYGFGEIRTPLFEETALFARGVGEETDIVSKEMYTFDDKGTSLTLRPENTASVLRAYIEHRLDQRPGLQRLYYMGPMFRRERPQKGRYRQFFQIGAEVLGGDAPRTDAEVIELVTEILDGCGVSGWTLLVNSVGDAESRGRYVARLREELAGVRDRLTPDNQRRAETNPLRVLDSKAPEDEAMIAGLPSILDFLNDATRRHFDTVLDSLTVRGIPYTVQPRLVRGLDYYTRTTFEVVHGALGAQSAVLGGGRYDGLAESLGSKVSAPGIGFSIGEDRLAMIVEEAQGTPTAGPDLFIAPLGDIAARHCDVLARDLRRAGVAVEVSVDAKLKRALETANKVDARYALVVGDQELAAGVYQLKDMRSGEQRAVSRRELADHLSRT